MSLISPAWAGRFFTTSTTWEAPSILHLFLITHTIGVYTPPEHSILYTIWSPPLCSTFVSTSSPCFSYAVAKLGCAYFLNHSPASPIHALTQASICCWKCSPLASPSVKTPFTLMVYFKASLVTQLVKNLCVVQETQV